MDKFSNFSLNAGQDIKDSDAQLERNESELSKRVGDGAVRLRSQDIKDSDIQLERNKSDLSERVGDGSVSLRGHPVDKRKTGGWKAAGFILALALGQVLINGAISGNLVPYAFGTLHLSIAESANAATNFIGLALVLCIAWGYIADSYFGRYWIISVGSLIFLSGITILTLAVSLPSLKPASCTPTSTAGCPKAGQKTLNWWYAGLHLAAVGAAGVLPCITSMGKDQFDITDSLESEQGSRWFPAYYFVNAVAGILFVTGIVYLETNASYGLGYGVVGGIFFVCVMLFFIGTPFYRHQKPGGSPITRLYQVIFVTFKNLRKPVPADATELHEIDEVDSQKMSIGRLSHTSNLTFFDKAAIVTNTSGGKHNSWRVCTVTQVEEFKAVLQIIPLCLTFIISFFVLAQSQGVTIQQASTLDRRLGSHFTIPASSTLIFAVLSQLIFIPLWVHCMAPFIRKYTGHPEGLTHLQQLGVTFSMSILAMVCAAVVEDKRVKVIKANEVDLLRITEGLIPMSVFYLLPQYALVGVLEFFSNSGMFSLLYNETPDGMRSLATSLVFAMAGVGFFISSPLVNAVNKYTGGSGGWLAGDFNSGGLRNYYWLLSVIMFVNLALFILIAVMHNSKRPHDTIRADKSLDQA